MNLRTTALASLSGLFLTLSFPAINAPFLAWIALIPLFLALKGQSIRSGFWLGGVAGMFYFAGTIHWITYPLHVYGGLPLVPAALFSLLLCAYLSLYPALFGSALVFIREGRPSLFLVAAPALWTALELARTHVLSGFPWSLLGYTQYRTIHLIQMADITGVYGVSFVIVLLNAAVADFLMDKRRYAALAVALAILVVVLGYGHVRLRPQEGSTGITISVVQGNIEQDRKWDPAYQFRTFSTYKRLTKDALADQPDLIIWPETATPFYMNGGSTGDQTLTADLVAFVIENGVPLLFGSPTYERMPNRAIYGRNSAFLLQADGRLDGAYHKMHLVPFGEYVPFKSILFFVDKMVQPVGNFRSGDEFTVMTIPGRHAGTRFSTVICYEIIFPDLVRRFVDRGANVITAITNDAWFGRTDAPYQHFSMAIFRAVENRVPIARAANSGISGFIDAKGNILDTSDIFTEAHLTRTITPGNYKTFYTRYGDVFSYACVIVTLILLAGGIPKRKSGARP